MKPDDKILGKPLKNNSQEILIKILSKSEMNKRRAKFFEDLNMDFFEGKNNNILNFLIQSSLQASMFGHCQRYLIGVDKIGFVIQLFEEWTKHGAPHEKDLFIIRFVMMYIFRNSKKNQEN